MQFLSRVEQRGRGGRQGKAAHGLGKLESHSEGFIILDIGNSIKGELKASHIQLAQVLICHKGMISIPFLLIPFYLKTSEKASFTILIPFCLKTGKFFFSILFIVSETSLIIPAKFNSLLKTYLKNPHIFN